MNFPLTVANRKARSPERPLGGISLPRLSESDILRSSEAYLNANWLEAPAKILVDVEPLNPVNRPRLGQPDVNRFSEAFLAVDWLDDAAEKRVRDLRESVLGQKQTLWGRLKAEVTSIIGAAGRKAPEYTLPRLDQLSCLEGNLTGYIVELENSVSQWEDVTYRAVQEPESSWADSAFGSLANHALWLGVDHVELSHVRQLFSRDAGGACAFLLQAVQRVVERTIADVRGVLRCVQIVKGKALCFMACHYVRHGLISLQRRFYLMHSEHPIEPVHEGGAASIGGTFQPAF